MWISRNLVPKKPDSLVDTAAANCGINTKLSAVSGSGKGQCEMVNPPGIVSLPGKHNDIVIIPTEKGQLCMGVRMPYYEDNVKPGEVLIMSDGGAYIKLANDGKVYINGQEF